MVSGSCAVGKLLKGWDNNCHSGLGKGGVGSGVGQNEDALNDL